ncbi:MAG: B12-binding domain-containing radical SAM protein, partial [bacterium]|nr:B12-binding domain-containing radical SAM protein [bacterium]
SYGWTKALSLAIKEAHPDVLQLVGGALCSTNNLLLTNTAVDVVFHGESEATLPAFVERLRNDAAWDDLDGISHCCNGQVVKNPPAEQITDLDEIPYPAYHLVDMDEYFPKDESFSEKFLSGHRTELEHHGLYDTVAQKLAGVRSLFPLVTARGCTHKCSFCYRHMSRYRRHSIGYVIGHLKYVIEKFGVRGVGFYDELFNGDMQWVFDFCAALRENDIQIAYKTSARADKVSKELLTEMSETGCFNLTYGHESGSDKILKEYRKGVTSQQNIDTTLLTRSCGIHPAVQLVIGSPGETRETIDQTVDFLKKVDARNCSINFLLPFPGAPIWKYVEDNNVIEDHEEYLDRVAVRGGGPIVNLTQVSDTEWRSWSDYILYKLQKNCALADRNYPGFLKICGKYYLKKILPGALQVRLRKLLNRARRK